MSRHSLESLPIFALCLGFPNLSAKEHTYIHLLNDLLSISSPTIENKNSNVKYI